MMDAFRPSILYVDDEQANLDTFRRAFAADYPVKTCLSGGEALDILAREEFALIIADQRMPGMTGIEFLERAIEAAPQSLRLILTAYSEPELLLKAINRGHVHDYIVKPWRKSELKPILEAAMDECRQRRGKLGELQNLMDQNRLLKEEIQSGAEVEIVGSSDGLKSVLRTIEKVAPSEATVLVLGETGTGKELLARLIHERSPRRSRPFVPLHCASLTKSLLESELFGHEKGAFTGAEAQKAGRFERAKGGTLFLDEIGEIDEEVQVKLLRVLQERVVERVGGAQGIPVDVRVVAATHRNLKDLVARGKFREDLFFRLNVIPITLPPLRERSEDILPLAEKFLGSHGRALSFGDSARHALASHDWPGNIRELKNCIERAAILADGAVIEAADLGIDFSHQKIESVAVAPAASVSVSVFDQIQSEERDRIITALKQAGGNISEAARILSLARSTLVHRLKKWGVV